MPASVVLHFFPSPRRGIHIPAQGNALGYERAGVQEYIVRAIDPDEIFWFGQQNGVLMQRPIDADGLYRSTVFPGMWLDPQALVSGDTRRRRAVIDLGCAKPERAAFVDRLAQVQRGS